MRSATAALPLVLLALTVALASGSAAQAQELPNAHDPIPDLLGQLPGLWEAVLRLPLAALLGGVLAFRPRLKGAPPRIPAVIQTQILLAVVGAVVMLIVGQSLARAFGIVGVASLVRYRAKIEDPKDAGVMLACLGIGLACGVGLLLVAGFATVFLLGFMYWVESLEPKPLKRFHLTVRTPDPASLREKLERLLRRQRATFELRSSSSGEISYEVLLPFDRKTDALSSAIVAINGGPEEAAVEWDEKKPRDRATG